MRKEKQIAAEKKKEVESLGNQLFEHTLTGRPFERGLHHGTAFRKQIQEHMGLWAIQCKKETGMEPEDYLKKFYSETDFFTSAEQYAPDLVEEIRGIAAGSQLDYELVFVRQLSDEEPWYRTCLNFGVDVTEHCTCFGRRAAEGKASNIIGQNMDTPKYYDGFQTLLRIREPDSDVEGLIFTLTGKLSLCGMNNYGVGVCCNSLTWLSFNRKGLAEDFIVRKVLQKKSMKEALEFMKSIPHASGQNYIIGGPDGVMDLECSANGVLEYSPDSRRLLHTNHPLVNFDTELYDREMENLKRNQPEKYNTFMNIMTTYKRLETLEKLTKNEPDLDIDTMKRVLSDHSAPLCIHGDARGLVTLGCVIMDLNEMEPKLHLSPGRPCETPFITYTSKNNKKEG